MSARYFLASSRIKQRLFLLDALTEVGVRQARRGDDVHRLGEQLLERVAQLEIGGCIFGGRALAEIGEEVEVARRGAAHGRSEQLEAPHAKARARRRLSSRSARSLLMSASARAATAASMNFWSSGSRHCGRLARSAAE